MSLISWATSSGDDLKWGFCFWWYLMIWVCMFCTSGFEVAVCLVWFGSFSVELGSMTWTAVFPFFLPLRAFQFFYLLRNGGSSSSSSEPYGIWGRLLDAWEFDFHLWMILSLVMTRTVPFFRKFIPVWTNWIPVLIRIVLDQYYSQEFWLIQSSKYQASWILFIIGSKSFHSYCDLTFYGWKPLGSEWNLVWLHPTGLVLVCVWRELGHTV